MTTAPAMQVVASFIIPGYMPNWQQPLAVIDVELPGKQEYSTGLQAVQSALLSACPQLQLNAAPHTDKPQELARYVMDCLGRLSDHYHLLRLSAPEWKCLLDQDGSARVELLFPTFSEDHNAINAIAEILLRLATGSAVDTEQSALTQAIAALLIQYPAPSVTSSFLKAAHAANIPWLHVSQNVYQFGWGKRSCLLQSTFTEHTSNIGVRMARFKHVAAGVLRQAGLPVPAHELVTSAEHAVAIARKMGFPVVIKPADLDKGVGVSANLSTDTAVTAAFAVAARHSDKILVEKHVKGRDFRIVVLRGSILYLAERTAAHVRGDGSHTIAQLIALLNQDPLRQPQAQRFRQLQLDDEMLAFLAEQGYQADSIPPQSIEVLLRRSASVTRGGTTSYPPVSALHPDNALLCIRAAAALRLDIAGIDLLIDDIGKSWREIGGAICEVNTQPEINPAIPPLILEQVIKQQGRIPVVAIITTGNSQTWWRAVEESLIKKGVVCGFTDNAGVRLSGKTITHNRSLAHDAAILLREPALEAGCFVASEFDDLRFGAPVDKLNLLIVAAETPDARLLQLLQQRSEALWTIAGSNMALQRQQKAAVIKPAGQLASALAEFLVKAVKRLD